MNLFTILTAKDLANMQGISLTTAYSDLKEIREHFGVKKVKLVHLLMFDGLIKPFDFISLSNYTVEIDVDRSNSIT